MDDANHAYCTVYNELNRLAQLVYNALTAAVSQCCKGGGGGGSSSSSSSSSSSDCSSTFGPHAWQMCLEAGMQPMKVCHSAPHHTEFRL